MAFCHSVIILLVALFYVLSHSAVEAVRVKTVTADSEQCGSTHRVGDGDSYRIIMPKDGLCPAAGFNCTLVFSRAFSSDLLPYHKRGRYNDEICVDFSRIRLAGKKTRLHFSTKFAFDSVTLTSSRYPLTRQYMDTVKCFSRYTPNVTLTFSSDCDLPGHSLRDYFTSWIYVYAQSSKKHTIYYLDGTCRHTKQLYSATLNFTIHSIFWRDTAQEPNFQNCSLQIPVYYNYDSNMHEKIFKLCTSWSFVQTSCEVSAHFHLQQLDGNSYHNQNYRCSMGTTSKMDSCVPNELYDKYFFEVQRNQSIADDREFEDGLSVFQIEGFVKIERKKKTVEKYEIVDFTPEGPEEEEEEEEIVVDALSLKILFPLAVLFSLCSCVCGISQKRAKQQRQQAAQNGEANGTASSARPDGDEWLRGVRAPPSPSSSSSSSPPPQQGQTTAAAGGSGRLEAPPPAYADLDHASSSSSPCAPRDNAPLLPLLPPGAAAAPPSASGTRREPPPPPPPPPPLSDGLPLAPPAYHELFPSRI